MGRNLWKHLEFKVGDKLLLEWTENIFDGRIEWVVPYYYEDYDDEDYSDINRRGFIINGEALIYPDMVTILEPEETTINLENLRQVRNQDLQAGDTIFIQTPETFVEFKITEQILFSIISEPDEFSMPGVGGIRFYIVGKEADATILGVR